MLHTSCRNKSKGLNVSTFETTLGSWAWTGSSSSSGGSLQKTFDVFKLFLNDLNWRWKRIPEPLGREAGDPSGSQVTWGGSGETKGTGGGWAGLTHSGVNESCQNALWHFPQAPPLGPRIIYLDHAEPRRLRWTLFSHVNCLGNISACFTHTPTITSVVQRQALCFTFVKLHPAEKGSGDASVSFGEKKKEEEEETAFWCVKFLFSAERWVCCRRKSHGEDKSVTLVRIFCFVFLCVCRLGIFVA